MVKLMELGEIVKSTALIKEKTFMATPVSARLSVKNKHKVIL